MKKICALMGLLLAMTAQASAQSTVPPLIPVDYRQKTFTVENPLILEYSFDGDTKNKATLSIVNFPNMKSDLFFFHMHANEVTAKKAGEESIRANGGTLMYLGHSTKERNMRVKIGKTFYEFDPNRIFTARGLEDKTVPQPKGKDLEELKKFVQWIEANISIARAQRSRPMVTALHNNTDDDVHGELLSIRTEQKLLNIDNRAVNTNRAWDIDNFYIATMKPTYDLFVQQLNPNISLRLAKPRDIGYLSNWMILNGIEYINVESQHDDFNNNIKMIEMIQSTFF